MPTAVMIESTEKTRSSSRIWKIAPAEGQVQRLAHHLVLVVRGIDRVVDLLGRLPDQEEAAGDQDQVAPGEAVPEGGEDGLGQPDDEGDGREQDEPHDQRRRDAEAARPDPVLGRQLVGQDRDEDEVVDAEHHLHRDQRHHAPPSPPGWTGTRNAGRWRREWASMAP